MKIIHILYLLLFSFNIYSQTKISGVIFKDTLMIETISNVRINLESADGKKIGSLKSNSDGGFSFFIKKNESISKIVFKKKGFSSITISPFNFSEINNEYFLKIVLKMNKSIHDEDYEGKSELISIEKIGSRTD